MLKEPDTNLKLQQSRTTIVVFCSFFYEHFHNFYALHLKHFVQYREILNFVSIATETSMDFRKFSTAASVSLVNQPDTCRWIKEDRNSSTVYVVAIAVAYII